MDIVDIEKEIPFPGFKAMIQEPLKNNDPISFKRIKRIFIDVPAYNAGPFRYLVARLTGKNLKEPEARERWNQILKHKSAMEEKLGRIVGIQTAAADFFDLMSNAKEYVKFSNQSYKDLDPVRNARSREGWIDRIYTPNYHIEKLKEELLRSKRYKHALSALLFDIDAFHRINKKYSYATGDEVLKRIVTIVKRTVRTVDIIARYSGDRFLVILPNTNKREAHELAERLGENIKNRSSHMSEIAESISITSSIGQCSENETSPGFVKNLENALERGKKVKRGAVYAI
ncbi:MAG: diguanylate cyclase [Chitinivibrionales bacterium]|nr:diguanylate cyclase [Chitinivibrionales bacterium]